MEHLLGIIVLVFLLICFVKPDYVKNKSMFVLAVLAVTLMFFGQIFTIIFEAGWARMTHHIISWVSTTALVPLLYLSCFPGASLAEMTKPQLPPMPPVGISSTPAATSSAPAPAAPASPPPGPPTPPAA